MSASRYEVKLLGPVAGGREVCRLRQGKLLLRRLYGSDSNKGWDADINLEEKKRWAAWFRILLVPAEACFPRSTKPEGAVGLPRLVGFGDSSMVALCVVLYIVWTDSQGVHHPRVLAGKCRVSPLHGTTIPAGSSKRWWCFTGCY